MDAELRTLRRSFALAGTVYLTWWFLVEAILPGSYNPILGRLAVVAYFFVALGLSFVSPAMTRPRLEVAFTAGAWLLTLHYFSLLHGNGGEMAWAVGTYVVVIAVGACLPTRRGLLTYSLMAFAVATGVSLLDRVLLRSIFLPGLATMLLLSNVTLRARVLLEQERAERLRSEAERVAADARVALRDEFISIASHELNTPLAALRLAVDRLSRATQRADAELSPRVMEEGLERCQRQVERLTRLVEELVSASRIATSGVPLHVEAVDLVGLVEGVAAVLAADAARAKCPIEIQAEGALEGHWDPLRLEQILTNLLRNAFTFGQKRPITIAVRGDATMAHVSVTDRGMGIAPADQARIFERFERAVSPTRYGGMGLGLYVARKLVEAHGGTIRVESALGQGSTFFVDLPREARRPSANVAPVATDRS